MNNIKSFNHSDEIEIKPITVFVGKNSCGKSSLLRFLVMLAQTFKDDSLTPLLLFGDLIDYGNYNDVAYRHEAGPIGFKINFGQELARRIRQRNHISYNSKRDRKLEAVKSMELEVWIDKPEKKMQVCKVELCLEGERLCSVRRKEGNYAIMLYKFFKEAGWENYEIELFASNMNFYKFIPLFDEEELIEWYSEDERLSKECVESSHESKLFFSMSEYIENNVQEDKQQEIKILFQTLSIVGIYFRSIQDYLRSETQGIAYIGPFRENPKRIYRDTESNFNDVGAHGENTSMILRQAAQEDQKLLENVSEWLNKIMGYSLSINDIGNDLYSLVVCGNGETDNLIDVGYGISQVLPIVTQLYNRNNYKRIPYVFQRFARKTVIFEQPELHLHPAAQAQLADLFVDCIGDKNGAVNRILIETHSEHLIRKLQVLIADPDVGISEDQVAIYYVDKDEKGDSHVERMSLCESGQFEKAWPAGFFDKSYELTKMLIEANSKVPYQEKSDD